MKIDLRNYPKFVAAYENDGKLSWEQSLHTAGFKSANGDEMLIWEYKLDDEEFTWFVLRWS